MASVIIMSLPCVIPVICVCFSQSVSLIIYKLYCPFQKSTFGFANFFYCMLLFFFLYSINVFYLYYFLPSTLCLLCLILSPKVENLLDFRAFFCSIISSYSYVFCSEHCFGCITQFLNNSVFIIIQFKIFSNFSCDLFLMHELFGSMLFHFQIAENFLNILLLLIPNLIPL